MRKKRLFFLFSFILLGTIGCATESSNPNMTITPTIEISQSVVENEETNTTKIPTPTKTTSSVFLTKETKEKEIITITDGLCEQLEQVDASIQAEYNVFNRMLSRDSELGLSGQSEFCIDETTGVVYFVNKAKDSYLYRMKDGEVQLAVAMPVKQIYSYQGCVYFMIENYSDILVGYDKYELGEVHNGDIYCYMPADGTVKLVYEAGAIKNSCDHRLTVNEKGVYFSYTIGEKYIGIQEFCYLPFGASEPIKDTERTTWKGWGDYVFDYIENESNKYDLVLQSRIEQEDGTRETRELSNRTTRFCVRGDYLYSAERTYISCLNLKTGEEIKYDFLEALQKENEQSTIENTGSRLIEWFTVTETDIWAGGAMILYRLNLETKELSYARLCKDKESRQPYYCMTGLYTDGKDIYVTCYSPGESKNVWIFRQPAYFARVCTDVVENDGMFDIMMLEILVE